MDFKIREMYADEEKFPYLLLRDENWTLLDHEYTHMLLTRFHDIKTTLIAANSTSR